MPSAHDAGGRLVQWTAGRRRSRRDSRLIVKTSPRFTVNWPALASSILEDSGPIFTNRRCGVSLLMPAALFRKTEPAQRVADRLPNLRAASMGPNEAGDRKARLQFEPPLGRDLGLLDAAEERQGGSAQEIRQAEARIGLFRFAAGRDRSLP